GNARTETSWSLVEDLCAVRQRLCNFRAGLCHGQFALRKGVRRLGGIVRMPRQVMAQAMHVRVPGALQRLELVWAESRLDDTKHGCARASLELERNTFVLVARRETLVRNELVNRRRLPVLAVCHVPLATDLRRHARVAREPAAQRVGLDQGAKDVLSAGMDLEPELPCVAHRTSGCAVTSSVNLCCLRARSSW